MHGSQTLTRVDLRVSLPTQARYSLRMRNHNARPCLQRVLPPK